MIWIQICFCSVISVAGFIAYTIHRIKNRHPAHNVRVEYRNPGERAWEDPDQKIPAPQYKVIIKLLTFILGFVGIVGFGLGFYISAQSNNQAILIPELTEELLETETPTPDETVTATITPTLFVEIEPTMTATPTPTDDLTITPYPTYTPPPTYTPYPTLESVVIERIIIVTPIDQQPTAHIYQPQAQSSSYGRVVPDQRGQSPQVYQPPPQQPIYIYPTAQFIIPSWESYITPTPRPSNTPRPTLSACPEYIETMFMTPTPSAAWCLTATPTIRPTETVQIIVETPTSVPTQTPYIIVVTAVPTETLIPTFTPTLTPLPTETAMPEPTATDIPTQTPLPPDPTPDEESTYEPETDN
jgi:hypothetical protein